MGDIQNVSRRAFIVGSAAVAGGIAFGSYGNAQQAATIANSNPLAAGLGPNSVTFNPWVEISPEKITLIAQHADIGQGVGSVQPIMIAEEMDLDPGQFEIRFAGPSPAYFNTGFADEIAPFLAADQSPAAEEARAAAFESLRKSGLQMTGGSSTVPDTYEKLRVAGAVARETLKAAAAKRSGVPVADIRTQSGHVILPDGTKIPYVELSAEAAKIPPVLDVKLRDPSKWRMLGKPMTRLDVRSKVMGELKFGIDLKMDGMLFASVKLNPNKGQPLKSYDASKAQSMPGVKKILEIKNGVAVIATNSWYAMKAVEAIDCEWAPSTYPAEQADHWKILEASFKPEFLGKEWRKIGDIDAGLKRGTLVEAEYRAPYVAHQPLEPLNGIGIVTDTGMEIWVGHQSPQSVQYIAATRDRPQAGTGNLSQSVDWWKFRAPSRIRERSGPRRDRKSDARNADQACLFARGGFSPGHSATDFDRPIQRERRQREDRRGRPAIGIDSSVEGAARAYGRTVEGSRSPIGRRPVECLLRHPEFSGHEL